MTEPHDRKWVVLAVVVAPLAIVPAWLIFGLMDHLFGPVPWVHLKYHYHSGELALGLPIGYLLTFLVGLPAFLILRRYQLHTLPMIAGVSLVTVFVSWVLVAQSTENLLSSVAYFGYYALWVAVAAWFIAVWLPRKRPNPALNTDAVRPQRAG